jgi:hypothetical protein
LRRKQLSLVLAGKLNLTMQRNWKLCLNSIDL